MMLECAIVSSTVQLYHPQIVSCKSLYTQRLRNFARKREKHEKVSRSAKMKLFDHISLHNLVIAEGVQASTGKKSMPIAEEPQRQQT